jgi:HlyD family secretion protein
VKKLLVVLVLLGLGLAGVAAWVSRSRQPANGEELFTFAPVEYGSLAETVGGSGVIQPRDPLPIMPKVAGQVTEVKATYNDPVEEGQVLCRLDDRKAKHELKQAKLAVEMAEKDVERAKIAREGARRMVELLEKRDPKFFPGLEKERETARLALENADPTVRLAELKLEQAREALQLAELALDLTFIRVPYVQRDSETGQPAEEKVLDTAPDRPKRKYIVMDSKAVLGRNVGPTETAPLFVLIPDDLDEVQMQALIAEGDISKVCEGMSADFTVSAYSEGDVHFKGKLTEIRRAAVADERTMGAVYFRVIIDVANVRDPATGTWRLRPGMTAPVDIIRRRHDNTWKMPTSAISFQLDEQYLTDAARSKLAQWDGRKDRDQWKPVWVLDAASKKPYPMFVRIGGTNATEEPGIRDTRTQFSEVLEWDPELKPTPSPSDPATYPNVIIGAPPTSKGGLLSNMPNIKF